MNILTDRLPRTILVLAALYVVYLNKLKRSSHQGAIPT